MQRTCKLSFIRSQRLDGNFKSKSANRLFIKTLAVALSKRMENFALLKPAANCRRQVSPTETLRILIGHLLSESCQKDVKILSKRFFEWQR